jgi:hypothetical protein
LVALLPRSLSLAASLSADGPSHGAAPDSCDNP